VSEWVSDWGVVQACMSAKLTRFRCSFCRRRKVGEAPRNQYVVITPLPCQTHSTLAYHTSRFSWTKWLYSDPVRCGCDQSERAYRTATCLRHVTRVVTGFTGGFYVGCAWLTAFRLVAATANWVVWVASRTGLNRDCYQWGETQLEKNVTAAVEVAACSIMDGKRI